MPDAVNPYSLAGSEREELLAAATSGDDAALYVARLKSQQESSVYPSQRSTQLYKRQIYGPGFMRLGKPLSGQALSIAALHDQVAALMEDGTWLIVSADVTSAGRPLALGDSRLISLASQDGHWLALAAVPGGMEALNAAVRSQAEATEARVRAANATFGGGSDWSMTRPAPFGQAALSPATTSSNDSTTGPATPAAGPPEKSSIDSSPASGPTSPATLTLVLAEYGPQGWTALADLPTSMASPIDQVSLAPIGKHLFVGVRDAPGSLRLWRLDGKVWNAVSSVPLAEDARFATLLAGGVRPAVWMSPPRNDQPDIVFAYEGLLEAPPATIPATSPAQAPKAANAAASTQPGGWTAHALSESGSKPPNLRSVVIAFGRVRSIAVEDDALTERSYDERTFAVVEASRVQQLPNGGSGALKVLTLIATAAAIMIAIALTLRRRDEARSVLLNGPPLPLASSGVRVMAGLIDFAPVVVALFYGVMQFDPLQQPDLDERLILIHLVGFFVTLTHMLLGELWTGRTIGKAICRLRVVALDGSRPTASQVVTRNLLRIIDVGLSFIPLLLVVLSPLRQRAGDAAAGTVVIDDPSAGRHDSDETNETNDSEVE